MCGIAGYVGSRPALPILIEALRRLEYRGYDSAGVAIVQPGRMAIRKAPGRVAALARRARTGLSGTAGIAHTRWATHGPPTRANAHPHVDCAGRIAVIHNGIIENFAAIKRRLIARGHRFRSQTDSEVVAHILESHWAAGPAAALAALVRTLRGQYAIVAAHADRPDEILMARAGPPLLVGLGRNETFVASDPAALLPHTRRVVFLEDGDGGWITRESHVVLDARGRRVRRPVQVVPWDPQTAERGGHPHHMIKEILDQPDVLLNALADRADAVTGAVRFSEPGLDRLLTRRVDRVTFVACGTAWHAARVGRAWVEDFARLPATAEPASEWRYAHPVVDRHTLVVAVSQSGETADTLACARLARKNGAPVLAVVNAQGSTLSREADAALWTRAGLEIGVAATKTYTAQLAALFLLAVRMGRDRGALPTTRARRLLADALRLPQAVRRTLALRPRLRRLARRFARERRANFMFVGRGVNVSTALEGALKLKEITYCHAEGYAAGEMKHGPLALVDARLPVIAVCFRDGEIQDKTLANLHEIRARGARITVATDIRPFPAAPRDTVLPVPWGRAPELSPIPAVVPLQILAYELAAALGRDIDKPRNLAKSVTVE